MIRRILKNLALRYVPEFKNLPDSAYNLGIQKVLDLVIR
mgnify:CR=1 FL=1